VNIEGARKMTAAEAGAIELEEPNWHGRFVEHFAATRDDLPIELREDHAFEETFKDYRRFHFEWLPDGTRKPLDSVRAVIGLAKLRIFPPRSRRLNIERDGKCYEPDLGDDHMWLTTSAGRAWRIEAIESNTLFLDSFGDKMQIDLATYVWDKHIARSLAAMNAAWP
jgi:hypothetical protein